MKLLLDVVERKEKMMREDSPHWCELGWRRWAKDHWLTSSHQKSWLKFLCFQKRWCGSFEGQRFWTVKWCFTSTHIGKLFLSDDHIECVQNFQTTINSHNVVAVLACMLNQKMQHFCLHFLIATRGRGDCTPALNVLNSFPNLSPLAQNFHFSCWLKITFCCPAHHFPIVTIGLVTDGRFPCIRDHTTQIAAAVLLTIHHSQQFAANNNRVLAVASWALGRRQSALLILPGKQPSQRWAREQICSICQGLPMWFCSPVFTDR